MNRWASLRSQYTPRSLIRVPETGSLVQRGAEGVILGCTGIAMPVSQSVSPVPLFDTASIHAASAVDLALAEQ
jgi:aspartate/glutamate racemase